MIPIKLMCGCGQKYAFDVEPLNGCMPEAVFCPVCGAEGTHKANEALARHYTMTSGERSSLSASAPSVHSENAPGRGLSVLLYSAAGLVLLLAAVRWSWGRSQSPEASRTAVAAVLAPTDRGVSRPGPAAADEKVIAEAPQGTSRVMPATGVGAPPEEGFVNIFNGHDLSDWSGDPRIWSVIDGVITGKDTLGKQGEGSFLIWTNGTVADFELRFSFRIPQGNSGVAYRAKDMGNWALFGYQYVITEMSVRGGEIGQLFESGAKGLRSKWLPGRGHLGTLGARVTVGPGRVISSDGTPSATMEQALDAIRADDWNEGVILAQKGHIIHLINGVVATEVRDLDVARRSLSGCLGIQAHAIGKAAVVQFKNIRLKNLSRVAASGQEDGPMPLTKPAGRSLGTQSTATGNLNK